jgi:hypothetical protein
MRTKAVLVSPTPAPATVLLSQLERGDLFRTPEGVVGLVVNPRHSNAFPLVAAVILHGGHGPRPGAHLRAAHGGAAGGGVMAERSQANGTA